MNEGPSLTDVVGLGIFFAGVFYSPASAAVIGPYIVIIMSSVVGASFALARRTKTTRIGALFYFVRVAGLAVLLTGIGASIASSYYDGLTERVLLAPVALLIGAVGDDWGALLRRAAGLLFSALELVRGKGGTH
jgi:hypothetical protein